MILLDNLTKSFGPRAILNGVSLEVPDGQNTVIIGASGAGKSVTLKLIVGLIEPDGGRVLVDDEVVQDLDRDELAALRGRIGYVFQFAALFDSLTVAENIRLGLVKRGYDESDYPGADRGEPGGRGPERHRGQAPGRALRGHAQAGRHRASDRPQAALHSL